MPSITTPQPREPATKIPPYAASAAIPAPTEATPRCFADPMPDKSGSTDFRDSGDHEQQEGAGRRTSVDGPGGGQVLNDRTMISRKPDEERGGRA